jgi:hypothetical protein
MIDFLLKKKINTIVRKQSLAKDYDISFENIIVTSNDFKHEIEHSDFALIVSETIDVPLIARVSIGSSDNYLFFSKEDFENDKICHCEKFEHYLRVQTTNYGSTFTPYKLKLLIITPYN